MSKKGPRFFALVAGGKKYTPDTPCKRGHLTPRISSTGSCIECRQLSAKARYHSNPQKTKERTKKKYQANANAIRTRRREAYAANPDKEKAVARTRSAEWRAKNPQHEGAKIAKARYKADNPGKVRADTAKRRTAKMHRTPAWLTADDFWMIEQAYELAALRTKLFGFSWHVDHVLPLQGKKVSGLHVPNNLQVIPWNDNVSKSNKFLPV